MIGFTDRAARQFRDLLEHYEDRGRPEAIRALLAAIREASRKIEENPDSGISAPRPYPHLARPGHAWIKSGRYWVSYSQTDPPVIEGVFYETSDIPRRV